MGELEVEEIHAIRYKIHRGTIELDCSCCDERFTIKLKGVSQVDKKWAAALADALSDFLNNDF